MVNGKEKSGFKMSHFYFIIGCVSQSDCASVSPCRKCNMDFQCVEMECSSNLKGMEVFQLKNQAKTDIIILAKLST